MKKEKVAEKKLMKVYVERKKLLEYLEIISGIIPKKSTLPILSNVLMEVTKDDFIILKATDLEMGLTMRVPVADLWASSDQVGMVCFPVKNLISMIKESDSEGVWVEGKASHWIEVKCDKSEFKIVGLDPEEFPVIPGPLKKEGVVLAKATRFSKIQKEVLAVLIRKTLPAISNEESRYHLSGALFEVIKGSGMIRVIGTDGMRLSLIEKKGSFKVNGDKALIPKKGLLFVLRLMGKDLAGEILIGFSDTHAFFNFGDSMLSVRLIDGEFPEYEQVIPKGRCVTFYADIGKLKGVLKRASAFMRNTNREGVKLTVGNKNLGVHVSNPDFGEWDESLRIEMEPSENKIPFPLEVGINERYVTDALDSFDGDKVSISLFVFRKGKLEGETEESKDYYDSKPILFRPGKDAQFCVIMPMRL